MPPCPQGLLLMTEHASHPLHHLHWNMFSAAPFASAHPPNPLNLTKIKPYQSVYVDSLVVGLGSSTHGELSPHHLHAPCTLCSTCPVQNERQRPNHHIPRVPCSSCLRSAPVIRLCASSSVVRVGACISTHVSSRACNHSSGFGLVMGKRIFGLGCYQ